MGQKYRRRRSNRRRDSQKRKYFTGTMVTSIWGISGTVKIWITIAQRNVSLSGSCSDFFFRRWHSSKLHLGTFPVCYLFFPLFECLNVRMPIFISVFSIMVPKHLWNSTINSLLRCVNWTINVTSFSSTPYWSNSLLNQSYIYNNTNS